MLFTTPNLTIEEHEVIRRLEELRKTLRFQVVTEPRRWNGSLRRVMFARAIQGSNTIEGYNVTLDDALALVEGEEPLDAEAETRAAIAGYRDAMTYVLQLARDPHFTWNEGLIRSLHFIMMKYDIGHSPGLWRTGPIWVSHEPSKRVVYEGPPAEDVQELMAELVLDLRESLATPALIRAAMAHLNLVMIHPFRDGNGRMARILQSLVLAQEGILAAEFASIEEYLGRNTQEYYDVLGDVGAGSWHPERDARAWVRFTLKAHFRQARTLLRRVRQAENLWTVLSAAVLSRGLPERTILALFDAAMRLRVRNNTYHEFADTSEAVGGRDLKRLVEEGFLEPRGEKRGRFYVGTEKLYALTRPVREIGREWEREDPFELLKGEDIQTPLPLASGS